MQPDLSAIDKKAGSGDQKPRHKAAKADGGKHEGLYDDPRKRWEMDAIVVCTAQSKIAVQVEPRDAWLLRGTRPSVELSGQRGWTYLLGAIIEDGDRIFSGSSSTSPPTTRNISFLLYTTSSKMV